MKKFLFVLMAILLVGSLALTACQPEAPAAEEPAAEEPAAEEPAAEEEMAEEEPMAPEPVTMVLGYTASLTGKYETSSGRQVRGLSLWMEDVKNAGVRIQKSRFIEFLVLIPEHVENFG